MCATSSTSTRRDSFNISDDRIELEFICHVFFIARTFYASWGRAQSTNVRRDDVENILSEFWSLYAITTCHTGILDRRCNFVQRAPQKLSRKNPNFFRCTLALHRSPPALLTHATTHVRSRDQSPCREMRARRCELEPLPRISEATEAAASHRSLRQRGVGRRSPFPPPARCRLASVA